MIARIWEGITLATKTEEYLEYLNPCVIPAYQKAKGNMGFFVMKVPHGELVHFLLIALFLWMRIDRWSPNIRINVLLLGYRVLFE
jgi:hypothetical protein